MREIYRVQLNINLSKKNYCVSYNCVEKDYVQRVYRLNMDGINVFVKRLVRNFDDVKLRQILKLDLLIFGG